ncbi:MAG: DUF29 domain-containing protein [Spirulina sp. SIO3F2]|nr:DUF29 domain-containing protein [Spirulina sp. SIO3F2]
MTQISSHPHNPTQSAIPYEQDYAAWLFHTVALLQDQQWSQLDLPHLIEELTDIGKRERRAILSNLEIILMHLLKYVHQPEKRSNSWRYTLFEHRDRITKQLTDSPSLQAHLTTNFAKSYQTARKKAALETGLDLTQFPETCPFSFVQTLDPDYLPD